MHEPERDRSGAHPLAVICVDEVGKAAPEPARRQHQHILRDFQIFEDDLRFGDAAKAHCGFAFSDNQTGSTSKREEATDPLLFAPLIEYPGEDQMEFGDPAARDPMLLASDNIGVAALVCTRRHLGRRRSGFRLGDADRGLVA